jgi:hypothetical protein
MMEINHPIKSIELIVKFNPSPKRKDYQTTLGQPPSKLNLFQP